MNYAYLMFIIFTIYLNEKEIMILKQTFAFLCLTFDEVKLIRVRCSK